MRFAIRLLVAVLIMCCMLVGCSSPCHKHCDIHSHKHKEAKRAYEGAYILFAFDLSPIIRKLCGEKNEKPIEKMEEEKQDEKFNMCVHSVIPAHDYPYWE